MATVTVIGRARAAVRPDRALVTVTLEHVAAQASDAVAAVSTRGEALRGVLDGHAIAEADRVTRSVDVRTVTEYRDGRQEVVGQRAATQVAVTVRDPQVLGTLLRDLVDEAGATVDDVRWVVADDNPVRRTLLGDAARDARSRAEAYATALGMSLGMLDALSETPLDPPAPAPVARMAMKAMDAAGAGDVPIEGGETTLEAIVHARFHLLPG
jgi:uncharacterized protein YggE